MKRFFLLTLAVFVQTILSQNDCQLNPDPYSTPLSFNSATTQTITTNECFALYINVTSAMTDDLVLSIEASDRIGVKIGYNYDGSGCYDACPVGFGSRYEFRVEKTTAEEVRIPICSLTANKIWYIVATLDFSATSSNANISISATTKTPIPLEKASSGAEVTITVPAGEVYKAVDLQLDTSKSHWFSFNNITGTSAFPKIYADGTECPTSSLTGTFPLYNQFRTKYSDSKTVAALLKTNTDSSNETTTVSFKVATSDVQCSVPTGLKTCSVPWATAYWQDAASRENYFGFVLEDLTASSQCVSAATRLACGYYFPKCDSNQFDMPPCQKDCDVALSLCPNVQIVKDICGTIQQTNTNCYVASGTTSETSGSSVVSVATSLAMFLFAVILL